MIKTRGATPIPVPIGLLTPRIISCLMADSMDKLFTVLASWNQEELEQLEREMTTWYQGMQATLVSRKQKSGLDEVYSEITTVIRFHLKKEATQ
jgi:hypothetical protein